MDREPVLVILNGLAAVLSLTLVALNLLGVTHLEPAAIAATVAAVTAACNLFAAVASRAPKNDPEILSMLTRAWSTLFAVPAAASPAPFAAAVYAVSAA